MKFFAILLVLLDGSTALAIDDARMLFSRALDAPAIVKVLEREQMQIISLKQNFILASHASHTNVEITFGRPDGRGGFSDVECFALQAIEHGGYHFIPAPEACRG